MITKLIITYLLLTGNVEIHGENESRPLFAFIDKHENYVDHAYAEEVVNYYITGQFEYDEMLMFGENYLLVNHGE